MKTHRKFWLTLVGMTLAATVIACLSTPAPSPTPLPAPTETSLPTKTPSPTLRPSLTNTLLPTETPLPIEPSASMVGRWDDPDTPGTVTTIEEQNGELVVVSVINPDRGVNELTWSKYENGVLSWEYCPQNMYCITSEAVSADADTLVATWKWSNGGNGGTTYFNRLPAVTETAASMAGRWDDPDTPGTVTTIAEQNGGYVVVSVINPDRGVNELTWSNYENGVLSWEYCPQGMYCITSETVSVDADTLVATWRWSDGGNGGTTYFNRLP